MRWTVVVATGMLTLAVVCVAPPSASGAVTQAQRCAVAKLRAAKEVAATVFECSAAEARGEAPSEPCLGAAYDRLLRLFARAERRRLCASRADGALLRDTIEEYRARIARSLVQPDPNAKPCEAARFDAVAVATANQIECFVRAARDDVVFDFDCLVVERLRLIDRFDELAAGAACAGGGAAEVLGELNFLVGVVGVRLPWTVCGNGLIELGENCDGGPLCDPSCRFALPSCCQTGASCFDASQGSCPPELGDRVGGAVCAASGQCEAQPIEPTELCCQEQERACRSTVADDTGAVIDAIAACPEAFGGRPIRIGECSERGRCRDARSRGASARDARRR
jgi:hypothetical protein